MDGIRRYAGIDWAKGDHAVCIIDERGSALARFEVEHSGAGLRELVSRLEGVEGVAIERPDGPVVEALLEGGLPVVVIASRHVKALRTRHGLAGNKDDRADAFILADALRTAGQRLRPLQPDAPATLALRASVRARKELVGHRTALGQQLAAHLALAFPGAVGLRRARLAHRSGLPRALPVRGAGGLARPRADDGLARGAGLLGPTQRRPAPRPSRGRTSGGQGGERGGAGRGDPRPRGCRGGHRRAGQGARGAHRRAAGAAPRRRPLQEPAAGRPGACRGAPRPDGDRRERFPTPESLACLAGATPSTRRSGQHRAVSFRYTCDKKLREALVDFAQDSRRANPWAHDLYRRARERGTSHPHAVRILARAWTSVIWRCWQDRVPYDPARHHALQRLILAPTAVAA